MFLAHSFVHSRAGETVLSSEGMEDDVEEDGGEIQTFLHPQHAGNVLSRLNDLWQREELCDVAIIVEGRTIKAHRAVLAASSQYFNAMFTRKMSERNQATVGVLSFFVFFFFLALLSTFLGW